MEKSGEEAEKDGRRMRRTMVSGAVRLLYCVVLFLCISFSPSFTTLHQTSPVFSGLLQPSPAYAQTAMEYYRELSRRSEATVGDAVHAVARAKGYAGRTDMYAELVFLHKEHSIKFRRDIVKMEDRRLTKGNAAHMMMSSLGIKGWVMQRIFRGNQRYALREAVYMKLLPEDSTIHQSISGSELLGFVSRAIEISGGRER